jgi:hypothetical protein
MRFRLQGVLAVAAAFAMLASSAVRAAPSGISAVWASEGGDKVMRHERRAEQGSPKNTVWDGATVRVFGAKNEVVNFVVVLESARGARDVSVDFRELKSATGATISSPATPAAGEKVYDWVGRNIEVFVVDYLQILGLSRLAYDYYDERHVPSKMRRPNITATGHAQGQWSDRPGADKYFPDIAVPHELRPEFDVVAGENQSVWVDVYVPKDAAAGTYTGTLIVREGGAETHRVPVELNVRNFALPDRPAAKTMIQLSAYDISERYVGGRWADPGSPEYEKALPILQRHWMMLHRHKLTPVQDPVFGGRLPLPEATVDRLTGKLYTPENGYDGPGVGTGDDVYGIGFYKNLAWKDADQATFNRITDEWENWFAKNAPHVDRFMYLADEPKPKDLKQIAKINEWIDKLHRNSGPGGRLKSFVTLKTPLAQVLLPKLDISASWYSVAEPVAYQKAVDAFLGGGSDREQYHYNGKRPASGSFAIEDDGVSPRMMPWAQWKKGISRWFFWESTYWYDFQTRGGRKNVWQTAQTYGTNDRFDPVIGRTGYNYMNGDGVLFYPGTDRVFPENSLNAPGPIASLRMKFWRRGVQDADYLELARRVDPAATKAIVERLVPRVLWEVGVTELWDPTWLRADISWPVDPDRWEEARRQLAEIIERG